MAIMNQFLFQKYGEKLATTSIEVPINTVTNSYSLPDDVNLRNKRVVGMFVSDNVNDNVSSPTARPLVSNAAIKASYLTLKQNNDEVLSEFALGALLQESGHREIAMFDFCSMNPQKSEIYVSNTALITSGESFVIQIIFIQ